MGAKKQYKEPLITDYGAIKAVTFTTPSGTSSKGNDPCYHLDKFDEMSGLSPTLCTGGEGLYDSGDPYNDGGGS